MRYRTLGRTGFKVSEIGHGLWGIGGWTGSSEAQNEAALHKAIEKGCNFFDSAFAYGEGSADALLGRVLAAYDRDRFIVASKVAPKNLKWPADPNDTAEQVYPKEHILESANKICDLLNFKHIDLLQLHVWDDNWTKSDCWKEAVAELKAAGTIKAFGISLNRWEPENGIKALRTGLVDTVQVIYNIFDQAPEDILFPISAQMNVGIIVRVPLDEGSLGGNFDLNTNFPTNDWRSRYFGPENLGPTLLRIERLKQLVPQSSTLAEMALRFINTNQSVSTTIVGMRTIEHVNENTSVSDLGSLEPNLMRALKYHRWDRQVTPWAN